MKASRLMLYLAALAVVFAAAGPLHASLVWDESIDGDLSNNELAPTFLPFALGSNEITGSMFASSDTRDFITFTIAPGQALSELRLFQYEDLNSGGPGNRGFHAINLGNTSFIPSGATAANFLGGDHLDPAPAGTDLLPNLAAAPLAGTGFTIPLGPGDYSYVIQQTSALPTGYTLDFVVIPEPSSLLLLSAAGFVVGLRRRRRA